MTSEELLKMLALDGSGKGEADAETDAIDPFAVDGPVGRAGAGAARAAAGPAGSGPTVLDLDQWAMRRGRDYLLSHPESTESPEAMADLFGAAFEPEPQLASEGCRDAVRTKFMAQLMETPEYHALHADTMLDETASEIAAAHFAAKLAEARAACDKVECESKAVSKGRKAEKAAAGAESKKDAAVSKAVAGALAGAGEEVEELREAARALGMEHGGAGAGLDGKPVDPRRVAEAFRRVRSNKTLRRICELAGRFRRLAQSKQRRKATHGYDDMVGVEPDGDVARLLPHEMAQIADEELELDALRRLVERQSLCRQYRSEEPVGKGPILVTIDESGSMSGEPANTAKALALAMAWVARKQNRWCGLIAYSGDSGHRMIALPPGRWDELALMEWLVQFIGRGSHLDVPVREMPEFWRQIGAPQGRTDVLMITDAECYIEDDIRDQFLTWKKVAGAKVTALVINDEPGPLAQVLDAWHTVRAIDTEEAGIGAVVSL